MPTHEKHTVIPTSRNAEVVTDHNIWVLLNPEFALDDWIIDASLEREDDELSQERNADSHGFNGHDPRKETDDGIFGSDWHADLDEEFEIVLSQMEREHRRSFERNVSVETAQYWHRILQEEIEQDARDAERREMQEAELEARFEHLPFIQSTRMFLLERTGGDLDDSRREHRRKVRCGKRNKPSHRPYGKDRYKGA